MTVNAARSWKTSHDASVILVATKLTVNPDDLLKRVQSVCPLRVSLVHKPEEEISVAKAWNMGCSAGIWSRDDFLMVTANDVIHYPRSIDALVEYGVAHPECPLWSGLDMNGKFQVDPSGITEGCDFAGCMLRPSTIDRFGWFDEGYTGAYFEDNDYVARLWSNDVACNIVHAAQFYHYGSQTVRLDNEAKTRIEGLFGANKARFLRKWGYGPAKTREEGCKHYKLTE
jgi:hypothetical protein